MEYIDIEFGAGWALDPAQEPTVRHTYRSSTITLGPKATAADARAAVLAECREQGYEPLPETVRVEETMPPVTATVVRRHHPPRIGGPNIWRSEIVDLDPSEVTGLRRWNHAVHEHEVVGTRWWGYVDVR